MDEFQGLENLFHEEGVLDELYNYVVKNMITELDTLLKQSTDPMIYLTSLMWRNNQGLTLLMAAALHGHDNVVRLLLTEYDPKSQIELRGEIILSDEKRMKGVTALYCACFSEHFTVAKTLIELGGADVNQDIDNQPNDPLLIQATVVDRLDIIRFLIENKYADVDQLGTDEENKFTALMYAARNDYIPIVEYLIQNGADVNYFFVYKSSSLQTPLSWAVINLNVESTRVLLKANAKIKGHNQKNENLEDTIEDLEFALCASIYYAPSNEKLRAALEILKLISEKRQTFHLPKTPIQPLAVYDFQQECQTVEELDAIKNDRNRIHMEISLVCERLFSSKKKSNILRPLFRYGKSLVRFQELDKCFDYWLHLFDLYQLTSHTLGLYPFVWIFCKMLRAKQKILVKRFLQISQLIFEPSHGIEKFFIVYNALFFVIIASNILKQAEITNEERKDIYKWIRDLCRCKLTNKDGQSIVHLCVDKKTREIINFRPSDIRPFFKFPNEDALRLLLTYGSRWLDLDAAEPTNGNTPLHILCHYEENPNLIKLLLDFGCHVDCVNKYGKTAIDYVENEEIKALLRSKSNQPNLKCLCAHFIVKQHLDTSSFFSSTSDINKFIQIHGAFNF